MKANTSEMGNTIKASIPLESSIPKAAYDFCEPLAHKR